VTGGWRRLLNEKFCNFYSLPYIIRVIKTRRIRWKGYVACMRAMKNVYRFFLESLKGRDHSEALDVGGSVILKWILRKRGWRMWIEFIWLRVEIVGGLL
jgi:hypothetical protein